MSSFVILSSSPVRTFARSPTCVGFSSPRILSEKASPDGAGPDANWTCERSRVPRDGFTCPSTTANRVLAPRNTAENLPISSNSPHKSRLRSPWPDCEGDRVSEAAPIKIGAASHSQSAPNGVLKATADREEYIDCAVVQVLQNDSRRKRASVQAAPLNVPQALARKKDWTSAKPTYQRQYDDVENEAIVFGTALTRSLGPPEPGCQGVAKTANDPPNKRRRINTSNSCTMYAVTKPIAKDKLTKKAATPRSKSPIKKGLTITGIATSYYASKIDQEETPMMQYLVSTQARVSTDFDPDTFETKVQKPSKARTTKRKSALRSPRTVFKSLDSQEIIFATASQSAIDEPPSVLRETIEAMNQSETHFFSSPMRSQNTAVCSIESTTPQKVGISRFHGRKNLWNIGDRNEHNALLHRSDSVEESVSTELPAAGNEPLIDPFVHDSVERNTDSLMLLATLRPDESLFDINDLSSSPSLRSNSNEPLSHRRQYSTAAVNPSVSESTATPHLYSRVQPQILDNRRQHSITAHSPPTKPALKYPAKPNYAVWSDVQLKEACQTHGIKRLRLRKSMINKLDEVWAEQHGVDVAVVKAATRKASQATKTSQSVDFLDKVYGVAKRPVPKIKGVRKKRVEPTSRMMLNNDGTSTKVMDDEYADFDVIDISDVETIGLTAFDRINKIQAFPEGHTTDPSLEPLEPSTAPITGTGVKAATSTKRKGKSKAKSPEIPLTPPPTMPAATQRSSPAFEDEYIPKSRRKKARAPSSEQDQRAGPPALPSDECSLKSRIRDAVEFPESKQNGRNHYENPTWYEKIQLYDPIVLEDFTAWLNTEGFGAIGEDDEIDANEVRDWCHENGVCCLWKGGWRGNKKKGKPDE